MTAAAKPHELARYQLSEGTRAVVAQRVDGRVAISEVPVDHAGRVYLIDRHVHSQAELAGLVHAYVQYSQQAGCPAVVAQPPTQRARRRRRLNHLPAPGAAPSVPGEPAYPRAALRCQAHSAHRRRTRTPPRRRPCVRPTGRRAAAQLRRLAALADHAPALPHLLASKSTPPGDAEAGRHTRRRLQGLAGARLLRQARRYSRRLGLDAERE
jgi:hypothetical protein